MKFQHLIDNCTSSLTLQRLNVNNTNFYPRSAYSSRKKIVNPIKKKYRNALLTIFRLITEILNLNHRDYSAFVHSSVKITFNRKFPKNYFKIQLRKRKRTKIAF